MTIAIRLLPVAPDGSDGPRPVTQLCGWPRLPASLPWPRGGPDFRPLHHLAQIDFAELPDFPGRALWPARGTLWLFADLRIDKGFCADPALPATDDPAEAPRHAHKARFCDDHAVLFHPDEVGGLAERAPPGDLPPPTGITHYSFDPWLPPSMQLPPSPMRCHAIPYAHPDPEAPDGEDPRSLLEAHEAGLPPPPPLPPPGAFPAWFAGPPTRREAFILFRQRTQLLDFPAWTGSRWDWRGLKPALRDLGAAITARPPDEPVTAAEIEAMIAAGCEGGGDRDELRSWMQKKLAADPAGIFGHPRGAADYTIDHATTAWARWLTLHRLAGFGLADGPVQASWPALSEHDTSCHFLCGPPNPYYQAEPSEDEAIILTIDGHTGWRGTPGIGDFALTLYAARDAIQRRAFGAAKLSAECS